MAAAKPSVTCGGTNPARAPADGEEHAVEDAVGEAEPGKDAGEAAQSAVVAERQQPEQQKPEGNFVLDGEERLGRADDDEVGPVKTDPRAAAGWLRERR